MTAALPYPPHALRQRVGDLGDAEDELAAYDAIGRVCREQLLRSLPAGWEPGGKRVLDFGCGAGRTLRHMLDLGAELWACDVDRASIAWLREYAGDGVTLQLVGEEPRLDVPDGHFDLIYAFSVFTHLSEHWAGWLLELHRALGDDGLLYATFLGPGFARELAGEEWDEELTGMTVLGAGTPWDQGGPCAIVSEWWLRAHWGRAFEVISLEPSTAAAQGAVLLRRRPVRLSAADLERPEHGEARELTALQAAQRAVMRDDRRRREGIEWRLSTLAAANAEQAAKLEAAEARAGALERELQLRARQLQTVYDSKSWRVTAPLRSLVSDRRGRR